MNQIELSVKINSELVSLQNSMKETIKKEEERGSSMQKLSERTARLQQRTHVFRERSKEVKNKMWYRNFRIYIFVAGVVGLLIGVYFFF